MNASLLAALASPTGKTPAKKTASKPKSAESAVVVAAAAKSNKENLRLQAVSAAAKGGDAEGFGLAPAFTVPEAPSAPGRMENLRWVLLCFASGACLLPCAFAIKKRGLIDRCYFAMIPVRE